MSQGLKTNCRSFSTSALRGSLLVCLWVTIKLSGSFQVKNAIVSRLYFSSQNIGDYIKVAFSHTLLGPNFITNKE